MNKRKEFELLLYGTTIESTCCQEIAKEKIQTLQKWLISNTPTRLYRFRPNTDYAVNALKNDEIWGSNIWELNDPYECTPFYNQNTLQKAIENELSFETILNLIKLLKEGIVPNELIRAFGSETIEHIIANLPDTIDESVLKKNCEILKQDIVAFIIKNLNEISNQFFVGILQAESQRNIACFSERNDSSLMWGHYSSGHKGFCLEYNFKSMLKPCDQSCTDIIGCNNFMLTPSIAPVVYSKTRFDATTHLFTVIQANIIEKTKTNMELYYGDTLLTSKCLLTKSSDWKYEKEWRLFSTPSLNMSESHKVIFYARPTAVYIGRRSSPEQTKVLRKICKEKNIPCYQMVQNYFANTFKLFPVLYDDYIKDISLNNK